MAVFKDGNKKVIIDTVKEYFAKEPFFYIKGRNSTPIGILYEDTFKQNGTISTNSNGEREFVLGQQGWDGNSTFLGFEAGKAEGSVAGNTRVNGYEADYNTGVGYKVLKSLQRGFSNVAIGYQAGQLVTEGAKNIMIGVNAGANVTTTQDNILIGQNSGNEPGTAISKCVFIGNHTGYNDLGGNQTILIGDGAAFYTTNTGTRNIVLGSQALYNATNVGTDNFIAGYRANSANNNSASNTIVIGYEADGLHNSCVVLGRAAASTADNQFVVGSATYNIGAVTAETITPDNTWTVRINGANYKIPLLAI